MKSYVDLVWMGSPETQPQWRLGKVFVCEPDPPALCQLYMDALHASEGRCCLFWHSDLGAPDTERILDTMMKPGDAWHAGLRLGMSGLPHVTDFVEPTWMLNRDNGPFQEATSWRLSLKAFLVKTSVLRHFGFVRPEFRSLDAAALELGHRYISAGALVRHIPTLLPEDEYFPTRPEIPFEQEAIFLKCRYGKSWTSWALARAAMSGYVTVAAAYRASKVARRVETKSCQPLQAADEYAYTEQDVKRVTVLIPTLDRVPYLRKLLAQLRDQTVRPHQVIVVDQTPLDRRDTTIARDFADLPLVMIYLDKAGQCSSRNTGLARATGDLILFLDDDVEVEPKLMERHIETLRRYGAQSSSGVLDEVGAGPLPAAFTYPRASDVFPTSNTLIHRAVLARSGLFDLAYERGQRADGDLGMRVYLTGALMVLNPSISVLHHHAPQGGLRAHKARVITYASSRAKLTHRHLPTPTEVYLSRRYFTRRQTREMLWMRVLGTFSARGGIVRKVLKLLVSLLLLPDTLVKTRKARIAAEEMLLNYPQYPEFDSRPSKRTNGELQGART